MRYAAVKSRAPELCTHIGIHHSIRRLWVWTPGVQNLEPRGKYVPVSLKMLQLVGKLKQKTTLLFTKLKYRTKSLSIEEYLPKLNNKVSYNFILLALHFYGVYNVILHWIFYAKCVNFSTDHVLVVNVRKVMRLLLTVNKNMNKRSFHTSVLIIMQIALWMYVNASSDTTAVHATIRTAWGFIYTVPGAHRPIS